MSSASYFDGQSTRRHAVQVGVLAGQLQISGAMIDKAVTLQHIDISEPLGSAPCTMRLPDGSMLEITQGPELDALLAAMQHHHGIAVHFQSRWTWALLALLFTALILAAGYRWGLPWAAEQLAPKVPAKLVTEISQQTLDLMDKGALRPSKLSDDRKAALQSIFSKLNTGNEAVTSAHLHFRSSPRMGPNAFALPDGQVVLLDELVALTDDDAEILGVLTHELGHVHYHHGIRLAIESSVISAVAAAWLGDVSSLVTLFSSLALTSNYSRDMEQQADDYAARRLRELGIPPVKLATMLEKFEAAEKKHSANEKSTPGASDMFASHPETAERIRRLKALN